MIARQRSIGFIHILIAVALAIVGTLAWNAYSETKTAAVHKSPDGHYWVTAKVNGVPTLFLVDTGSTAVALTIADAKKIGIAVDRLTFREPVMTVTGNPGAAAVPLQSVAVDEVELTQVKALVVPGLDVSLLGMSYLGRLKSFEATPKLLVLRGS